MTTPRRNPRTVRMSGDAFPPDLSPLIQAGNSALPFARWGLEMAPVEIRQGWHAPRSWLAWLWILCPVLAWSEVHLQRTPFGGIQPQAVIDASGTLHVVFYQGPAKTGDLHYTTRPRDATSFTPPIKVNSSPGSAMAVGTIRGAHLSLGRDNRVHVVWNGSQNVTPGDFLTAPLLYTRLRSDRSGFEPERDIMTYARGLDGGSSVAADARGNVYVVWHAVGDRPGEDHRRVYLSRSSDDGISFARELAINPATTGACGCCGLKALADTSGAVFVLYRSARQTSQRDAVFLTSKDGAAPFRMLWSDPWTSFTCPMSSAGISQGPKGVIAAWETRGQVFWSNSPRGSDPTGAIHPPDGNAKRKHPVVAANGSGEVLLAWAEGTGWEKSGRIGWQVFDRQGRPQGEPKTAEGLPVWGLLAAVAEANGDFTLIY